MQIFVIVNLGLNPGPDEIRFQQQAGSGFSKYLIPRIRFQWLRIRKTENNVFFLTVNNFFYLMRIVVRQKAKDIVHTHPGLGLFTRDYLIKQQMESLLTTSICFLTVFPIPFFPDPEYLRITDPDNWTYCGHWKKKKLSIKYRHIIKTDKNIETFFSEISSIFDKIVRIWIFLKDPDPEGK